MEYKYLKESGTLKEKVLKWRLGGKEELLYEKPFDLRQEAVLNFAKEIKNLKNHKVLIVGDYDVDGITSVFIMRSLLEELGIAVAHYIPSRFKEGYGLNAAIVLRAKQYNFDTILCLDNGIVAYAGLEKAGELGLNVLIIDHHEYHNLPDVKAILHPDFLDSNHYDMCTAGLCALVYSSFRENDLILAYAGLATLADMVTVLGTNRYLLKKGLELIDQGVSEPLLYLACKKRPFTYTDLSFSIIPKLNAVSRLENKINPNHLVYFLGMKGEEALRYAVEINKLNDLRKNLSKQMQDKALYSYLDNSIIYSASDTYYEGLCGITAAKLVNAYNKPAIVMAIKDDVHHGSARSIEGIDLYNILKPYQDNFLSFGGHAQALGFSFKHSKEADFIKYLNSLTIRNEYKKECLLLKVEEINCQALKELKELEPFGPGFEEPLFALYRPAIKNTFLIKGIYPKYIISKELEAISFHPQPESYSYMIGHLSFNNYKKNNISLTIDDFKL